MQYKDSYVTFKLESCSFLEAMLVCVCGMPSRLLGIFTHDGGYYTKCSTCSLTLSVEYVAAVCEASIGIGDFSLPGIVVDLEQSDVLMDLWCVCGAKTQFVGKGHEELKCQVCRLSYFLKRRLSIRALPRGHSFDFNCNSESPYPSQHLARSFDLEEESIETDNVPNVDAQVAAFKANPLLFWSKLWLKEGE